MHDTHPEKFSSYFRNRTWYLPFIGVDWCSKYSSVVHISDELISKRFYIQNRAVTREGKTINIRKYVTRRTTGVKNYRWLKVGNCQLLIGLSRLVSEGEFANYSRILNSFIKFITVTGFSPQATRVI